MENNYCIPAPIKYKNDRFRVWGSGFKVQRFRVQGSEVQGSEVQGSRFRGSGFKVQRFKVQRFKVQGSEVQGSKVGGFRTNEISGVRFQEGWGCREFGLRRTQPSRSETRRRPIGRGYAAAKDAECGK